MKKGYFLFIIIFFWIIYFDVKMYNLKSGLLKWFRLKDILELFGILENFRVNFM